MLYAQKNYLDWLGSGKKYRIDQAGCFLVAFTNLASNEFGISVDPLALNADFINKHIYVDAAPKDGAFDDLGWDSIIRQYPELFIVSEGLLGSRSVVKQQIRPGVLHFSKIDHVSGSDIFIVDSYDGRVKNAAVYGPILDFRTYGINTPQPPVQINPYVPPAAAPGNKLFLPAVAGNWRVYNVGGPWKVGSEIGKLWPGNPAWAPGLTYDILGTIAPNVFRIRTGSFGEVAIYAGPDTIAQFVSAAPAAPAPVPVPAPVPAAPTPTPVEPVALIPQPTLPLPPVADVPVHTHEDVKPAAAPSWKDSYVQERRDYVSTADVIVKDMEGLHINKQMVRGKNVHIDGWFMKDGKKYFRTVKNAEEGLWYGIPDGTISKPFDPSHDDDLLELPMDDFLNEARQILKKATVREKMVALIAAAEGIFASIGRKFKGNKK